jgi:hypothetical protein
LKMKVCCAQATNHRESARSWMSFMVHSLIPRSLAQYALPKLLIVGDCSQHDP